MVRQQARSKPEFASQEWVERQMTDDGEGFSQGDLIEILRSSFALVLCERLWCADPRDDIFTLRVHQELTV